MKTVGILGGGQLGLMLANSLYTLGAEVVVYDPDPLAPLCRHAGNVVNGSWNDYKKIEEFVKRCDIITYEFENVECDPLRPISAIAPIYPSLDVLAITQNRINEKQFLSASNLPHVKFAVASSLDELRKEGMSFRFPFVIKTARGGYDGKGQFSINNEEDLENALKELSIGKGENSFLAVLEEFIEIESEVSCIVARDLKGSISTFPVFENFHKNHILDKTYLPCSLPENIQAKVIEIANQATVALDVNGLLTTEFFVSRTRENETTGAVCGDYTIHINEFAPRPHNSGHITRNACHSSQFDALAKILLEVPVTDESLSLNSEKHHCMVNILGDSYPNRNERPGAPEKKSGSKSAEIDLSAMKDHGNISELVLYGKTEAREGRKMGHFVAWSDSRQSLETEAQAFQKALKDRQFCSNSR